MELELFLLLGLILFFASLVHGTIGLGFPMIATPLLALFMDLQSAILYTLIPTVLVNLVSIMSEGKLSDAIKTFYPLIIFGSLGTAVGTWILLNSDGEIFKLLLAVMILLYLLLDQVKFSIPWIQSCPTCSMRLFGLLAGVLSGLTNAMAPILIIYFLESKYEKAQIIQGTNLAFISGKIVQLAMFSSASLLSITSFSDSLLSLIFVVIALFLGLNIKKRVAKKNYKVLLKAILLIIAILLLFRYFA